jgi:hypothetical protein
MRPQAFGSHPGRRVWGYDGRVDAPCRQFHPGHANALPHATLGHNKVFAIAPCRSAETAQVVPLCPGTQAERPATPGR